MELVTGAMSTLLPKLADLIKAEYNLQKSVRAEITFLKTELEYMEAALVKVSEAPIDQPPDPLDKLWARDVRELSYDLEDSIDAFLVRIDSHAPTTANRPHSFGAFMERSMNLLRRGKIRHNIGVDIEDYKRRINEVKERRDRYKADNNIPSRPLAPSVDALRLSALYTEATKLVGIEERSDELVKMLMEGDDVTRHHLKIISIFGFGGLGKTTLARKVYQKLRWQFACGAIVTVSHNPNLTNIFKNLLQDCGHSEYDGSWDDVQLINKLREFLLDKRYFIVIDDIWETRVWEALQFVLIDNVCGSRVISTTRNLDVAKKVGDVYKLQPLSHANSRKLFDLRIFGTQENSLPNELHEVSENILKKCGGVPLAIIMIASMLASGKENTHKYWSKVYKIMGSGLQDSPDPMNDMRRILSISYYDLPPHLKTCMLYLCSYPEDYQIPTKDLILKWFGEGFIVIKEKGKSFYEVGGDYIDELMNRSMIQLPQFDHYKKATYFCIHDTVLDLITHLSNEHGFLTTLDGQRPIYPPKKIRRLSLQSNDVEVIKEDVKKLSTVILDHVRSLTVSSQEAFSLLPAHYLSFSVLRLLDLSGGMQVDNDIFKGICSLFHLRYLRLSSTSITKIPKEIKNLQLLHVLDVSGTKVQELPSFFLELRQLLYLCVKEVTRIPDDFGSLEHLQAVDGIIIVKSPKTVHNLTALTELRRVQLKFITWDERCEKAVLQCLPSLVSLEYLELGGCNDLGSQCDGLIPAPQQLRTIKIANDTIFRAVPRWMSSLCILSTLHITLLTLGEDDLHVLGSLPSLYELQLFVQKEATQGRDKKFLVINAHTYLCLEKFKLQKTIPVVFVKGAMEKL